MIMGYYKSKKTKLMHKNRKFLRFAKKSLIKSYGTKKAVSISSNTKLHYNKLIAELPYFQTPIYDALILQASHMIALKKGMRDHGIGVEEFVQFIIETIRMKAKVIPFIFRKIAGQIYISPIVRPFLKSVGKSATRNDWPTEVIDGKTEDVFSLKIRTQNCQMLNFITAVGEEDLKPYCSLFDFTMAESLGLGLQQTSDIDTGTCEYCFYSKGSAEWPDAIKKLGI